MYRIEPPQKGPQQPADKATIVLGSWYRSAVPVSDQFKGGGGELCESVNKRMI